MLCTLGTSLEMSRAWPRGRGLAARTEMNAVPTGQVLSVECPDPRVSVLAIFVAQISGERWLCHESGS